MGDRRREDAGGVTKSGGMRVVIDGRPLVGNRTGIGVHTAEITKRLPFETIIASHKAIEDCARSSSLILHRSSFIPRRPLAANSTSRKSMAMFSGVLTALFL